MPNVMLTYRCNLSCKYCFACEFVNTKHLDITPAKFKEALDFLATSGNSSIGLIGGEPTLHDNFKELLEIVIHDDRIKTCVLYTNGILLDHFTPQLTHSKFRILVNCNSPSIIGRTSYQKIVQNLDTLVNDYYMKDRITLGINLYSNDMDYQYILDLLQRYGYDHLRISVTVPNIEADKQQNPMAYFKSRKEFLMEFYKELDKIKVLPHHDCNVPPPCIWDETEKQQIEDAIPKELHSRSNLIGAHTFCSPVIDVLPDLRAVRCFGMSDFLKVPISDFKNLNDLRNFFRNTIDANSFHTCASGECQDCYERKVGKCSQGCLAFQQFKLRDINNYLQEKQDE